MLIADREQIFRALMNLSRNAVEAMGEAGELVIEARGEGGKVIIDLADNGPGLNGLVLPASARLTARAVKDRLGNYVAITGKAQRGEGPDWKDTLYRASEPSKTKTTAIITQHYLLRPPHVSSCNAAQASTRPSP